MSVRMGLGIARFPFSSPSAFYRWTGILGWTLRGTFHGVSPKHLQRYLNEFVFRFNQRWQEADLFSPVLHGAIAADPLPYQHSTAERTG
jgi:hypothetical protein